MQTSLSFNLTAVETRDCLVLIINYFVVLKRGCKHFQVVVTTVEIKLWLVSVSFFDVAYGVRLDFSHRRNDGKIMEMIKTNYQLAHSYIISFNLRKIAVSDRLASIFEQLFYKVSY